MVVVNTLWPNPLVFNNDAHFKAGVPIKLLVVAVSKQEVEVKDMDYVDLIYCHRPDLSTRIEETVRAMDFMIDQGWAFYWGTSEWSAHQITEAWEITQRLDLVGPIVEQPEYNLMSRHKVEAEFLPLYTSYGIGLTTWSPFSSGVLTRKYNKGNIPSDSRFCVGKFYKNLANRLLGDDVLKKVDELKPIADELGVPVGSTCYCLVCYISKCFFSNYWCYKRVPNSRKHESY